MISSSLTIFGQPVLAVSAAFFLAGIFISIISAKNSRLSSILGFGFALIGSILALVAGISPFIGQDPGTITLVQLGQLGSLSITIDSLSGLFVSIIAFVGIAVSIYSFSYINEYEEKGYNIGRFTFLYNIFLLSMIIVVTAQNALLFLVVWETMALSSFFLVTYEHKEEGVKAAGFTYLLITHVGAVALILMFLVLAGGSGSLDFSSFPGTIYTPMFANAIFILALIGFGSKCGILPLHTWLPLAHPQAPSNISALMSGVMLKVGIYGVIRVLFGFLGIMNTNAEMWWGVLILIIGMFSSVLGVLYSLLEHDLKRLLAMHSIENIGIIFIGLGAAVLFSWARIPELAALSLFAALYHTFNHALFKSLLFLGAGSIAYATHERNIEELGGLAKHMPVTAILFLLGSASIAAIPPLNGFVSELLTFEALLGGIGSSTVASLILSLAVLFLALTSALAVGAFVKAFGIPFLGLPRSSHASKAKEVPKSMLIGMGLLAFACILAGALPTIAAQASLNIFSSLHFPNSLSTIMPAAEGLQTSVILLMLVFGSIAVGAVIWFFGRTRNHQVGDTWGCGFPTTPQMQYSAAGFAMPVTRTLKIWLDPLSKSAAYGSAVFDYLIYLPLSRVFHIFAPYSAVFQSGKLSDYLMYLIITLTVVLIYAVS